MNNYHVFLVLFVVLGVIIRLMPRKMTIGLIVMSVGIMWCAFVLLSTMPGNETSTMEFLNFELEQVIVACFVVLIGAVFTSVAYLKREL
ncbi:hypothetical protein FCM30_21720 [Lelliottia aquatilis]|uniref:hypothetical protein n=1 Tax=Lelliottia aquatilis TaxID=2080838 RepID=UPI001576DC01|nr:hypothetical protein [Lelliottia aquatilis]NTZ48359.1 hypothetical protein [Lelliottia aquatilis]